MSLAEKEGGQQSTIIADMGVGIKMNGCFQVKRNPTGTVLITERALAVNSWRYIFVGSFASILCHSMDSCLTAQYPIVFVVPM
jgi:hypothetical protein